jgi:histidinol-phosphate aminotransferase
MVSLDTLLRPGLDDLEPYEPVRPLDVIAEELGLAVSDLAKLDANENLYGPIPAVREAAAHADFHIYPDPAQVKLREAIGEYLGVSPDSVIAGAGSDELLDLLFRALAPEKVVTTPPTFGMYRFLAGISRCEVVEVMRGEGFELDLPGIEKAVAAGATLLFIASPNNPTGNPTSLETVRRLCELPALVVVDEAYAEFAGETAVGLVAEHENLVILRTFSKWAALAGLRVGYGVCAPSLQARLMAMKQPYNVNAAADAAACAAIRHREDVYVTVRALIAEKERMVRELARFEWLAPHPSAANFVLFKVLGHDVADVAADLRRQGVLVRTYSRPELQGYLRISAGRPQDTDRLLAALEGSRLR